MMNNNKDVVILGGGLAGLSLAYQLKLSQPELDVAVIEKQSFPRPEKTAKVGESTVEIGAHYLKHTLGLEQHFKDRHLRKYGLRCFFGQPQDDFSQQDELGVSQLFGIPAYQIDRGALENYLQGLVIEHGVDVFDNAVLDDLTIEQSNKSVSFSVQSEPTTLKSKWIVDTAGRQAILKNKLDLHRQTSHKGNALWFRIDRQVKLDDWSTNSQWHERIKEPKTRWLSTNHLMGPGYWVWIIPLDNGATSIGIVMDDQAFAEHDFSNYDSTFKWLSEYHPVCAQAIEGADVLDYVVINDYALDCKQMFSDEGWAMSGESGVFADPFYSPGSDFIALNNSFITELISKQYSGNDIRLDSRVYQSINQSFFDSTLSLYTGEYGGFGDRRMMSLKLVWDYAYYWGVLSLLFFKTSMIDIKLMRQLNPTLSIAQKLNTKVQSLFRERAKQRVSLPAQGLFLNQYEIPCLRFFNQQLDQCDALDAQTALQQNTEKLQHLAGFIEEMLCDQAELKISTAEQELLGDYRYSVLA